MSDGLDALRRAQDRELARRGDLARVRSRLAAPRRHRPRARDLALAALVGLAATAAIAWLAIAIATRPSAPSSLTARSSHGAPIGSWLVVPEGEQERVTFSDGSELIGRSGARLRIARIAPDGADVVLDRGAARLDVVHRDDTAWRVLAGPYVVRVTGTQFEVCFDAHVLSVQMTRGAVVVEGPGLDAPAAVVGGQRFTITEPGWDRVASPPASGVEEVPTGDAATTRARRSPRASGAPSSTASASTASAPIAPAPTDTSGSSAAAWLARGDEARTSGRLDAAELAYQSLRADHPGSSEARTAAFALGLIAFQRRDPARAAGWMRSYLLEAPEGPLSSEARGRWLEALVATHDMDEARTVASAYLAGDPQGPHAALARRVLASGDAPHE